MSVNKCEMAFVYCVPRRLGPRVLVLTFGLIVCVMGDAAASGAKEATSDGLKLEWFDNVAFSGTPHQVEYVREAKWERDASESFYAQLSGSFTSGLAGAYNFSCSSTLVSVLFVWIDGHLVCHHGVYKTRLGAMDNPLLMKERGTVPLLVRAWLSNPVPTGSNSQFEMRVNGTSLSRITPDPPAAEKAMTELQQSQLHGWGTWIHGNILALTKLPEAIVATIFVCKGERCIKRAIPGEFSIWTATNTSTRVGARGRHYARMYVGRTLLC